MITCGSRKIPRALLSETTLSPYLLTVRRVYTTALQSGNLKAAMHQMKRVTQNLFCIIEQKRIQGSIDIQKLSEKATLDTIGEMAFYSNFGGLDGSRRLGDLIESVGLIGRERLSNPLKKLQCLFFPHSKEVLRQQAEIRALRDEWDQLMVAIDAKEDPPEGVEPIWYAMKQLNDPESGMRLDKESLRCEMATVVAAGMATTAHQLSWTLALLAGYPRVLKQLVEELVEHDLCGSDMRDITFDDFSALTYLSAVVKEGLRLAHIVAFGLPSVVPRDMNILGYRVPKGTLIVCPGNQGYSTEADWGDPEAFRPERWLANEDMSQKYYLPFSVGPRDCPGQRLALFVLRLFIAEFVRRYELCLEGTYADLRAKARESIVTVAQGGIWMNFTPRTPST